MCDREGVLTDVNPQQSLWGAIVPPTFFAASWNRFADAALLKRDVTRSGIEGDQ
jgi:hypothetical protein